MIKINLKLYIKIIRLYTIRVVHTLYTKVIRCVSNTWCILIKYIVDNTKNKFYLQFPCWLLPGLIAVIFIFFVMFTALYALYQHTSIDIYRHINYDIWRIVKFTTLQALLSTCFSVLLAIILAIALYRRHFPGRTVLLNFCSITLILPVLVGIFGITTVFGNHGWLAYVCTRINLNYNFSIYDGLNGILLAHIFFNLPIGTRLFLQTLESIPKEQRYLAAQLKLSIIQFFILVEWPYLRQQFKSVAILIFVLCFNSFTIIMVLGGGKYTTIELEIYRALNYDFDTNRVVLLVSIQMMFCLSLTILYQLTVDNLMIEKIQYVCWYDKSQDNFIIRLIDSVVILIAAIFLLLPLLAVIFDGINFTLIKTLSRINLWIAVFTSLFISIISGILCLLITIMLLWSIRELKLRKYCFCAHLFDASGILILTVPSMVLSTGWFILLINNNFFFKSGMMIILINTLMAIPYVFKLLKHPMQNIAYRYSKLCLSLNIKGLNRFILIEYPELRQSISLALAFSCVLSLGDFGITAIFGNEDFQTLPLYFYQQIENYQHQESAVIALLLLIICLLLFNSIKNYLGINDKIR